MLISATHPKVARRILVVFGLLVGSGLSVEAQSPVPSNAPIGFPSWWFARGVIVPTNPSNNSPSWPGDYPASDDFAVVNQGQLKSLATAAAAELDNDLPSIVGGEGNTLHSLIAGWATSTNADNYAAVNLGQLKSLAKPFYDQLITVTYTNAYPWSSSTNTADDYALANIGQVKSLFGFDLTTDTNNDGIPDWWERFYGVTNASALMPGGNGVTYLQAYQQGLNPNDPSNGSAYNGATPTLSIVSGNNQTGPVNGLLPQPLIVSVTDGNGNPYINAPVTFSTGSGLQTSSIGPPVNTITVQSDGNGQAKVFLTLPNTANATVPVIVNAGSASHKVQTTFSEQSDNGSGTYVNPFVPSQVTANVNVDGSVDITWINNADPNDPRPIQVAYMDTNNTMQTITTVPAGSTSYHVPPQ